ncbi:hypothetical protein L7F22_052987 [Adiantum nelumboides]|nr:hypothetical protein [Adiantum nelumboides]
MYYPNVRVDGVVSLAWAQDGRTLFYTLSDETQRPYRHTSPLLRSDDIENINIFTESNPSFCVDIASTKDGKFITVYLIDAANPLDGLQKVWKRVSGVQFFLEHHHELFYVLTNAPLSESKKWSGEGYYLASCRLQDLLSSNWHKDFSIQDMDMFDDIWSFLSVRRVLLCFVPLICLSMLIHLLEPEDLNAWFFPMPQNSCTVVSGSNHDFQKSVYRAVLSSPVMPDVVVDYDMSSRRFSIVQQEEVIHFCDRTCPPTNQLDTNQTFDTQYEKEEDVQISEWQRWKDYSDTYCCERREVISHDGYGAYGEVLYESWCAEHMSLLDRGWVVAFADVRGGGGDSSWHKSGNRLGAIGHSAGGLLVGATINMYPDLFCAAILKVPFLDICNTLMDPSLPLTILDYEEFGNPQIRSAFEHIFSYSPYDNISQGSCYPSMLVTASLHDSRLGLGSCQMGGQSEKGDIGGSIRSCALPKPFNQMAALDYYVSIESDIFVPTYGGNMAKVVEGHRRYLGYKKTILLDRRVLVDLIDQYNNGTLSWNQFSVRVKAAHADRMGNPTTRLEFQENPKKKITSIQTLRVFALVNDEDMKQEDYAVEHAQRYHEARVLMFRANSQVIAPPQPQTTETERDYENNGYLMVSSNGGLNQMRAGICDMVAIARFMNVTLIVPELDNTSFWNDRSRFEDIFDVDYFISSLRDEVRILKVLPHNQIRRVEIATLYSMPLLVGLTCHITTKWLILPRIKKYGVLHFTKTDARLANNGIPKEVQELRCKANYKALRFTPPIEELGKRLLGF